MSVEETHLNAEVMRLARRYSIRAVHVRDGRGLLGVGTAGLPDWLLVGREVAWRELKPSYRGLDRDQTAWRYALEGAGQDFAIWRPLDLQTGRIAQELQALAPDWAMPV
jgi:hypothetical protein